MQVIVTIFKSLFLQSFGSWRGDSGPFGEVMSSSDEWSNNGTLFELLILASPIHTLRRLKANGIFALDFFASVRSNPFLR